MSAQPGRTRRSVLNEAVATLDPGCFALVMATGIVSIGVHDRGLDTLSAVLLWIAAAGYAALVVLTAGRAVAHPAAMRADAADPRRGFGFFTIVAGTGVLGARLTMDGHPRAGVALLAVGVLAWLVLSHLIPRAAILGRAARPVVAQANGTWFLWTVAGQSVAVLATTLDPALGAGHRELTVLAVVAWSAGVVLYAVTGVLVAARLALHPPCPADLTPPYWVAMGATAITVVAGARIVRMAHSPADVPHDVIAGVSVAFWVLGTGLIPPLLAAGWWRHVTHRVPLRYDTSTWSIVFPLGMYGVAGHDLGHAVHLPIVRAIGDGETWVALAAWTLTFIAMLVQLGHGLRRR